MHEEIEQLLREKGELGVNAIAAAIGKPISTVHVFLNKQGYFVKTESRKWDLPERVLSGVQSKAQDLDIQEALLAIDRTLLEIDVLKAKLQGVYAVIEGHIKIVSLNKAITNQTPAVAGVAIPKKVKEFVENVQNMQGAIRKNIAKIPEQYRALIEGLDYLRLTLHKGAEYVDNVINTALTGLIIGEITELDKEVIELFETYQRVKKKSDITTSSDGAQQS